MKAIRISLIFLSFGAGILLQLLISSSFYFSSLSVNQDAMVIAPQRLESSTLSFTFNANNKDQRIAWLMTFPNSGTTYTSYLIRRVTLTNTASNYGHDPENMMEDGSIPASVGIFADNPIPSWTESWNDRLRRPSKGFILTKTHCGGNSFCKDCESHIYNSHTFLKKCLEGVVVAGNATSGFKNYDCQYSKDKIARAVHLIRDPFDNVVARFHHERKSLARRNIVDIATYPNTREGFRDFCDNLGKIEIKNKIIRRLFFEDVLDLDIPCKADFYRYIQWHNLAFTTTWNLGIPALVFHYESFATNFNKTKDDLLEFLEQDEVNDAPVFSTGKTYRNYYTTGEIDAVSRMFDKLALRETLLHTKHYFSRS
jgi:hypothetical protein